MAGRKIAFFIFGLLWASPALAQLGLEPSRYFLVTLHRAENVDIEPRLRSFAEALNRLGERHELPIIVSTHPRTAGRLREFRIRATADNVRFLEPFGFFDFIKLEKNAACVLSDSGGVQEEAPALATPLLVLRETSERREGIAAGTAKLVGTDVERIVAETEHLLDDGCAHAAMAQAHNPYGDGTASKRIVEALARDLSG